MNVKEFLILSSVTKDDMQAKISRLQRPSFVYGRSVPTDLYSLTIGELFALQAIKTENDAILIPCKVILNLEENEVMKADAEEVFGFIVWVANEMAKINKLFERTRVPPTKEEKQAGVEQLNFGAFGIIDWYAQRMGITDHEAVEYVPWMRVYKCLEMDAQRTMYEKRLRDVYANSSKQ